MLAAAMPAEGHLPRRLGQPEPQPPLRADRLLPGDDGGGVGGRAARGIIRQRMPAMDLLKAMYDAEENGCMPPSMAAKPDKKAPDRKLRWVEWLAFDPVAQLKELDRESAKIAAAKGVEGKVGRKR